MRGNICCFAGHGKEVYDQETKNKVYSKCDELVSKCGINEFWVGNYGSFDRLAAGVVRELKQKYSYIELSLILPYLTNEVDKNKEWYYKNYDSIIIADISENTPNKYKILKCNQYMINNSRYLIAYVDYSFGGAFKTLKYAAGKKHIEIFNLGGCNI